MNSSSEAQPGSRFSNHVKIATMNGSGSLLIFGINMSVIITSVKTHWLGFLSSLLGLLCLMTIEVGVVCYAGSCILTCILIGSHELVGSFSSILRC